MAYIHHTVDFMQSDVLKVDCLAMKYRHCTAHFYTMQMSGILLVANIIMYI